MPGVNWAKNLFLGSELTKKEMEDIPFPRLELHVHVMYKTIQMGSIVGIVFAPVVGLLRKKPIVPTIVKFARNGAAVGVVMGPVMTEGMLYSKKATPESVWDRCYRLRYNPGQVRTDRYASFCALAGTTVTSLTGAGPINGALLGFVTGTLAAGIVGNQLSPSNVKKPEKKDGEAEEKKITKAEEKK